MLTSRGLLITAVMCFVSLAGCVERNTTNITDPAGGGAPAAGGPFELAGAVSTGNTTLAVTFGREAGAGADDPANYQVRAADPDAAAFVIVTGAIPAADGARVTLTTLSQAGIPYIVTVNNVRDRAGVLIDASANTAELVGTPPAGTSADSDGDGLPDVNEQLGWTVTVFLADGTVEARSVSSQPDAADSDGDGVSDEEERRRGTDPRDGDTDGDGLGDADEIRLHFSGPARQDTDGDGITDGDEVHRNGTSPILADTDGDQYTDADEIFARNSHPLIADVPEARVEFAGDLDLRLNVQYTDGTSISTQDGTRLSRAEATSQSLTDTTVNQQTYEFGQKIGASAKDGLGGEVSAAQKFMFEESVAWNETTSQEVRQESERIRDYGRTRTESASSGTIGMGLRVKNTGDVAFTLRNLVVSVLQRDPVGRRSFKTLATLNLNETLLGSGVTLGPFNGQTGVIQIANTEANAALVKDLLADPTGIMLEVGTFDLLDSEGRNFAFLSEVTNARTALITIDYGDGRVERYRVATGVDRNPDGTPGGISMGRALREILAIDYETDQGQVLVGADSIPVVEQRLIRVKDVVTDEAAHKAWAVLGSRNELVVPGLNFDDMLLKGGDSVFLAYITDADGDGLSAREEFLHRTKDSDPDTDGDGLTDYEEIKVGWIVVRDTAVTVYSDPLSSDGDRDGLTDIEERDAAGGATDPLDPDTDGDGFCDGPGVPGADPLSVCRRSNRDANPLEPALTVPPTLLFLAPETNAVNIPVDTRIEAVYDQKLDAASTMSVYAGFGGRLFGSTGFGANQSTLQFNPPRLFHPGERVEVTLDDVRNIDGFAAPTFTYRFRAGVVNTGTGGALFAPLRHPAGGRGNSYMPGISLEDFNGDGFIDLATAVGAYDQVAVALNRGDGTFQPALTFPAGQWPIRLAAADLDGDGDVDVATANKTSSSVTILLNVGDGRLVRLADYATGVSLDDIVATDLNGDPYPDLAVVSSAASRVITLINNGDTTFSNVGDSATGGFTPVAVASIDLDGAGDRDLITANAYPNTDKLSFITNLGGGALTVAGVMDIPGGMPKALVSADLDGNGGEDIVVGTDASNIVVVRSVGGPGSGLQPPVVYTTGTVPGINHSGITGLTLADINGDGQLDVVASDSNGNASWLVVMPNLGGVLGTAVAFDAGAYPEGVAAADLNGDGRTDLAVSAGAGITLLTNNGPMGGVDFVTPTFVSSATGYNRFAVADLNGDGDLDVAVGASDGVVVHLNAGGILGTAQPYGSSLGRPNDLIAADLDGNGVMELVATFSYLGSGALKAVPNLGNGTFGPATDIASMPYPSYLITGDWNGDGNPDLATIGATNTWGTCTSGLQDNVSVLINSGNGSFSPPTTLTAASFVGSIVLKGITSLDTDGDGDLDLAVTDFCNHRVVVFANDGTGLFTEHATYPVTTNPTAIVGADLDGDFDADLAVTGRGHALSVLANAGGTGFAPARSYVPNTGVSTAWDMAPGDMDGDGDLDLIVSRGYDVLLLKNDGAGRFALDTVYFSGSRGDAALATADMDGDGDLDVPMAVSGNVVVLENRVR